MLDHGSMNRTKPDTLHSMHVNLDAELAKSYRLKLREVITEAESDTYSSRYGPGLHQPRKSRPETSPLAFSCSSSSPQCTPFLQQRRSRVSSFTLSKSQDEVCPPSPKPLGPVDELVAAARANNLSWDICKQASELFRQFSDLDGSLSQVQFVTIVCQVAGCQQKQELPPEMLHHGSKFWSATDGTVNFAQFALWFSTLSFTEMLTVSSHERELRDLCREHRMSMMDAEKYQRFFKEIDSNGNGRIDESEFAVLVHKCAKVPEHIEIPAARLQSMFQQVDKDGNGSIDVGEFLAFYQALFDNPSGESVGFESFYRNIRPVSVPAAAAPDPRYTCT